MALKVKIMLRPLRGWMSIFRDAIASSSVCGKFIIRPSDQFYGDRHGSVKDPSANTWWIATHKEDVSSDELKKRAQEFMNQQAQR